MTSALDCDSDTQTVRPNRSRSNSPLTGTFTLARLGWRRDRMRILWWAVGIGMYWAYCTRAAPTAMSEADLQSTGTSLLGGPMGRLLSGPTFGYDDLSYDRFLVGTYGLYAMVLVALMSLFMVVRHTRAEEESGRAELIRSNVVGRHAALTAAVVVTVAANLIVGAAVWVVSVSSGHMAMGGSTIFVASVIASGFVFVGVGSIASQLTSSARSASGLGGMVLGIAFVLRAVGDMAAAGGTAISWLSPLAWSQQAAPFVINRWWPIGLSVVASAAMLLLGLAISERRDFAGSVLSDRRGPSQAPPWLGSPMALSFRLQRGTMIAWTLSIVLSGAIFGAWADALVDATGELPEVMVEVMGGDQNIIAGYLGVIALTLALLITAFAILAVQQLRTEEMKGRAEAILATPVSRPQWLVSQVVVAVVGIVIMSTAAGLLTGLAALIVTGDSSHVWTVTATQLSYIFPVIAMVGLAALFVGLAPQLSWLTWLLLGYSTIIGFFSTLLNVPRWVLLISPFEHIGIVSLEPFGLLALFILFVIAAVALGLGVFGMQRRDIGT